MMAKTTYHPEGHTGLPVTSQQHHLACEILSDFPSDFLQSCETESLAHWYWTLSYDCHSGINTSYIAYQEFRVCNYHRVSTTATLQYDVGNQW